MTDLTKITTPFEQLDSKTREALEKWEHGIEWYDGEEWKVDEWPVFYAWTTYRARPAPLVPDTIDWSHVTPEWKWMGAG